VAAKCNSILGGAQVAAGLGFARRKSQALPLQHLTQFAGGTYRANTYTLPLGRVVSL